MSPDNASHEPGARPDSRGYNANRHSVSGLVDPSLPNQSSADAEYRRSRHLSNVNQDSFRPDASRYTQQARQPINAAVESAFSNTNTIPPDQLSQLTAQITANVLQQLQAAQSPSPPHNQTSFPPGAMVDLRQTASSPERRDEPEPEPYRASEEAAVTPSSPSHAPYQPTSYGKGSSPQAQRPMSPYSQASQAGDSDTNHEERPTRPKGPRRISTGTDATIIEKTWGALFSEDGLATARLGQFLRGIAVHIIEDYEPKHSLVITPDKIQKYYDETKLDKELYPWPTVFDDHTSSISRLFRLFEVQHHLVAEHLGDRPAIPALTPHGFEKWMTLVLRAHPDEEFDRLAKTALNMPINNPDNRKERFPKELSRRLFPAEPDTEIRRQIQEGMKKHCDIPIRQDSLADNDAQPSATSYRDTEPVQPSFKVPPVQVRRQETLPTPTLSVPGGSYPERERKPYSTAPSEVAESEEGEDLPTPQPHSHAQPPIERERKPYVAEPGGGQKYENLDKQKPEYVPPEFKPTRTMSMNRGAPPELTKTRTMPIAIHQNQSQQSATEPVEIRHARSNSFYNRTGRGRSPSLGVNGDMYGHSSDTNMIYGTSPYVPVASFDVAEDARRQREYESIREHNATDRYDAARMAAYDPRDRQAGDTAAPVAGAGGRPRMQTSVGILAGPDDRPRSHYEHASVPGDDYYRNSAAAAAAAAGMHHSSIPRTDQYGSLPPPPPYPPPQGMHQAAYPPSAYRT